MCIRVDKNDEHDVFIGRPSIYGNPFIIGKDGTRSQVIEKFEEYFTKLSNIKELLNDIEGKRIACWCKINDNCHGDVIVKLIKNRRKEEFLNNLFD